MQLQQLPTFEQSEAAWENGTATPLNTFIYDNETFDNNCKFREDLVSLLNWAQAKALEEDAAMRRNNGFIVYNGAKQNLDAFVAEVQPRGWNKKLDKQVDTICAQLKKLRDIVAPNPSVQVCDSTAVKTEFY